MIKRLFVLATLLLAAPAVNAQPKPMMGGGGGGKMPDLSQIVGRPLADPGMAKGTVRVRVARKMPVNAVEGAKVSAIIKNAGGDSRRREAATDDKGYALFEGMAPGDQFRAEVTVDGEKLSTEAFTMPETGGIKTMLIAALESSSAGAGAAKGGPPAAGGKERTFALGATAGAAEPDTELPTGTLEVRLFDENAGPIANHAIVLGLVKEGDIETRNGKSDAAGRARFTDLPVGPQTGYAVVIDWKGLRLNTVPFGMPESGGARAEIHALARTGDPAAITIGAGGRLVVQMSEDTLQILEFLPLENTSDKMFDPGPGAFEIPLPGGFVGAQAQDNERKVEVRQNHGMAVHGPIVPKRSQLIASDSERKANEVVFGFVLPYHGDTHDFSQPAPNGIGELTLITDQKATGLTVSGPGIGPREERVLGGRKYWVMSVAAVPAGGAIKFTLSGLPSSDSGGRWFAFAVSVALVIGACVFARQPTSGAGGKRGVGGVGRTAAEEKKRLVGERETLFSELVALERGARAMDKPVPVDQRRELVTRLEQVYQDIAALDKPRAA